MVFAKVVHVLEKLDAHLLGNICIGRAAGGRDEVAVAHEALGQKLPKGAKSDDAYFELL